MRKSSGQPDRPLGDSLGTSWVFSLRARGIKKKGLLMKPGLIVYSLPLLKLRLWEELEDIKKLVRTYLLHDYNLVITAQGHRVEHYLFSGRH